MKSFKTLTLTLKAMIMAFALAGLAFGAPTILADEPPVLEWPMASSGSSWLTPGKFLDGDGNAVDWADGSILYWTGNNTGLNGAVAPYGIRFNAGGTRYVGGENGRIELGAGGIAFTHSGSGRILRILGSKMTLDLAADQTWTSTGTGAGTVRIDGASLTSTAGAVLTIDGRVQMEIANNTLTYGHAVVVRNGASLWVTNGATLRASSVTVRGEKSSLVYDGGSSVVSDSLVLASGTTLDIDGRTLDSRSVRVVAGERTFAAVVGNVRLGLADAAFEVDPGETLRFRGKLSDADGVAAGFTVSGGGTVALPANGSALGGTITVAAGSTLRLYGGGIFPTKVVGAGRIVITAPGDTVTMTDVGGFAGEIEVASGELLGAGDRSKPVDWTKYPELWCYVPFTPNTTDSYDRITNAVGIAADNGYNAVAGLPGNVDIMHDARYTRYATYLDEVRDYCDLRGVEMIPMIWSPRNGWPNVLSPDVIEARPVKGLEYVVSGATAVRERPEIGVANAGFEELKTDAKGKAVGFAGWQFIDGFGTVSFADTEVFHGGGRSVRFDLDGYAGAARVLHEPIPLRGGRFYQLSAWFRRHGMPADSPFGISIRPVQPGGFDFGFTLPNEDEWTRVHRILEVKEDTDISIYLSGGDGREGGSFWIDDLTVTDVTHRHGVVRREGLPFAVVGADSGRTYVEGVDYGEVPGLSAWGKPPYMRDDLEAAAPLELTIPAGSAIADGERLLVSFDTPPRREVVGGGETDYIASCMCAPEFYAECERSAAWIAERLNPKRWFLAEDEIRYGGTCSACLERHTDMAHVIADCYNRQIAIVRSVRPDAEIVTWSDMINPFENARSNYYGCASTFEGAADLIPKDVIIADWSGVSVRTNSESYFRDRGFRTLGCGYYDKGNLVNDTNWVEVLNDVPGALGLMYCTWSASGYDYSFAPGFADLLRDLGKPKYLFCTRTAAGAWSDAAGWDNVPKPRAEATVPSGVTVTASAADFVAICALKELRVDGTLVLSGTRRPTCAVSGFGQIVYDAPKYWFLMLDEDGSSAQPYMDEGANFALDDGTRVAWQDGNMLYWHSAKWPDPVAALGPKVNNGQIKAGTLRPIGMVYYSGDRSWSGNGRLELGPGGFSSPDAWGTFTLNLKGGLHFADSQAWRHKNSIRLSLPVTSEPGVTWTVSPTVADVRSVYVKSASALPGCRMVIGGSERLVFESADASLGLDELVIEGADAAVTFDAAVRGKTIDASCAKRLTLRDGAALGAAQAFDGMTLDLESIVVASGACSIGDGAAYAVRDGGVQVVEVRDGASLMLASLPTSGRLKLTGRGTVSSVVSDLRTAPDVDLSAFEGRFAATVRGIGCRFGSLRNAWFSGTLGLVDSAVRIDDLAGYDGDIVASGFTSLVLPPTSDWPEGFTVTLADTAQLILPEGRTVDEARILGTKNYRAVGKGYDRVTEDVTVGADEECVIAYDGFTAGTKITIDGGRITFPAAATVGSDIEVAAKSWIGSAMFAEGTVTGRVDCSASLSCDSATKWTGASAAVGGWISGRVVLAGGGEVAASATLVDCGGELEFRGGAWTFTGGLGVEQGSGDHNGIRVLWSKGAKADFVPNDVKPRSGLYTGSNGYYPVTLEITEGSTVRFDRYRMLRLGNGNWRHMTDLIVDNATLKIETNDGQFGLTDIAYANNRTPMGTIVVRNGGVIETDRVLDSMPVNHGLDARPFVGRDFVAGLHLVLDGGTYRLGPCFGADADAEHPAECCNHLFAMTPSGNKSTEADLGHTAEIEVTIGANGGTFDLAAANPKDASFSNTVAHAEIEGCPCLGPRWTVNGPLAVKGNGSQELVLNGLAHGQLSQVTADGAVVKVIGDFGESYGTVTLGAAGGGVKVESESGAPQSLAIGILSVAAGGVFDAANFDWAVADVGELAFGENAALCASNVGGVVPRFSSIGSVKLAAAMGYACKCGVRGVVLRAESVEPAGGVGVVWTKVGEGIDRTVRVSGGDVVFGSIGSVMTIR